MSRWSGGVGAGLAVGGGIVEGGFRGLEDPGVGGGLLGAAVDLDSAALDGVGEMSVRAGG